MSKDSQLVLHEDFRAVWGRVVPGLLQALMPQQGRVMPEDVFTDLALKRSLLFLCDDGFIIFKKEPAQQAGEWDLLVWWSYMASRTSVIQYYEDQVLEIARTLECSSVSFLDPTGRRGYARVLPEEWEVDYVKWSRKVPQSEGG
jgi:hypothetical protein